MLSLPSSPNHLLLLSAASSPSAVSFAASPLTHTPSASASSSSKPASSPAYAAVFSRKACSFAAGSEGDVLVEVYPQGALKIWAISASYEEGSNPEITLEREISALPGLKQKDKETVGQAGLSEKGTLQVLSESCFHAIISLSTPLSRLTSAISSKLIRLSVS